MRLKQAHTEVVDAALELLRSGLVRGTAGNVSVRPEGDDLVVMTPTGVDYRRLDPADVSVVGLDGRLVEGLAPSSELPMHLAVYRARADVRAIVHTHSVFATTLAVLGEELPGVHYVLAHAGRRVQVAPYATYGSETLARGCVEVLGADWAVLLANHGVLAAGPDLPTAMAVAEAVEYTAELYWRARQVGTPAVLADEEMDRVAEAFRRYGQPSGRDLT